MNKTWGGERGKCRKLDLGKNLKNEKNKIFLF